MGIAYKSQTITGRTKGDDPVSTHNNRSIEDRRLDGRVVPSSSAYFSKAHTWPRNPAYVAFEYSNLSPIKKLYDAQRVTEKPRLNPKLRFCAHSHVRRPLNSMRDTSVEQITRACATCHTSKNMDLALSHRKSIPLRRTAPPTWYHLHEEYAANNIRTTVIIIPWNLRASLLTTRAPPRDKFRYVSRENGLNP